MEPFLPLAVTQALQALGDLSLVIIVPCTLYNTVKNLSFGERLQAHIDLDNSKFTQINQDVGRLMSVTNDLRNDKASGLSNTLEALLRKG